MHRKSYYNKNHLEKSFNVGNQVYLTAKNITTRKPSDKLNLKFIGPFRILEPIGSRTYRLELPTNFKDIHPVFHVLLLCKCCQSPITGCLEALHDNNNRDPSTPIPELILDSCHNFQGCLQYFIKWTGTNNVRNTWELAVHLEMCPELFQGFHQDFPEKPRANVLRSTRDIPRGKGQVTSRNMIRIAPDNQKCKKTRGRPRERPRI